MTVLSEKSFNPYYTVNPLIFAALNFRVFLLAELSNALQIAYSRPLFSRIRQGLEIRETKACVKFRFDSILQTQESYFSVSTSLVM